MAYISLDDGTGSIELLAFQKVIDVSGGYMQTEALVIAYGRISEKDDKEPQIVLETLRPISDAQRLTSPVKNEQNRTLYVKLSSEESPEYERLKLVHMMFPGSERMIVHFGDTKKNVGTKCIIHDAFVNELSEMLGSESVVIR